MAAKHAPIAPLPAQPPALDGVSHEWISTPAGIRIHVALAGPADGSPVLLVHGFPQHWWEWRAHITALAADGYRVIAPDLRGAGWSDAPPGPYLKAEMAADLAAVLDALDVGPVMVAAHDWGGPVAFCLLFDHPDKVSGVLGLNTIAPLVDTDIHFAKHLWRLWYQLPMLLPVVGPKVLGQPDGRFLRMLHRWAGPGYAWPEADAQLYLGQFRDPARAEAQSQWYRTFQTREFVPILRGRYAGRKVTVPVRFVTGLDDPVITPNLHRWYGDVIPDCEFETVSGVGHWIVEQAPELVLERLRRLMKL